MIISHLHDKHTIWDIRRSEKKTLTISFWKVFRCNMIKLIKSVIYGVHLTFCCLLNVYIICYMGNNRNIDHNFNQIFKNKIYLTELFLLVIHNFLAFILKILKIKFQFSYMELSVRWGFKSISILITLIINKKNKRNEMHNK